eukprot:GHVP01035852.1.p1 GENE.GHVP01035852.1~~GHVP01035852.1.p1  ORF type:complete len:228 (+),score=45.20 GHVP01035852.1:265-948(+)
MENRSHILDLLEIKTRRSKKEFFLFSKALFPDKKEGEHTLNTLIQTGDTLLNSFQDLKDSIEEILDIFRPVDGSWKFIIDSSIDEKILKGIEMKENLSSIDIVDTKTGISVSLDSDTGSFRFVYLEDASEGIIGCHLLDNLKHSIENTIKEALSEGVLLDKSNMILLVKNIFICFRSKIGKPCPLCKKVFLYEKDIKKLLPPLWITTGISFLQETAGLFLAHRTCLL